ncbi:MAG: hypothetical protein LBB82_04855 [Treponema sp.]|nr:hypothetical protein [Treponema sp.]
MACMISQGTSFGTLKAQDRIGGESEWKNGKFLPFVHGNPVGTKEH